MRTWYVPLEMLDPQRLLAQHREIHALLGSIGSPKFGYQNHPVTKLYLPESGHLACLLDYHELTVAEMKVRGWHGHRTPLTNEQIDRMLESPQACGSWLDHADKQRWIEYPEHGWERDLHELAERWENEGKQPRNDIAISYLWAHAATHRADRECVNRIDRLTVRRKAELLDEAGIKVGLP